MEIIDKVLGCSGASIAERTGFARLTAEVALGQADIVLGLEVSRLARNNADWYRLLDLCGLTNTLIGDADGICHPRRHYDRPVLGMLCTVRHNLKGHLLRDRAARLPRTLAVGDSPSANHCPTAKPPPGPLKSTMDSS